MYRKKALLIALPMVLLATGLFPICADGKGGIKWDFDGKEVDENVWIIQRGKPTQNNGILSLPAKTWLVSKEDFAYLYETLQINCRWTKQTVGIGDANWGWRFGSPWQPFFLTWRYNAAGLVAEKDDGKGRVASSTLAVNPLEPHTYKIEWTKEKGGIWYIDSESVWEQKAVHDKKLAILLCNDSNVTMEVDWVLVGEAPSEAVETAGKLTTAWGKLKAVN